MITDPPSPLLIKDLMKLLVIEHDRSSFESLASELWDIDQSIEIVGRTGSVAESIQWYEDNVHPDLILMATQLPDGTCFEIFKSCLVTCPVIFMTAGDKYLTEALEYNGIDYLQRPVRKERLKSAIRKYKNLQNHFVNNHSSLLEYLNNHDKKKSRVLVRKELGFHAVRVEDIVYFFTENKLVFLVDKDNKKFLAEKYSLSDLEYELDPDQFFRANRKYIINANFLKRFKMLDRSKVRVELQLPISEEIIVSQENATSFKKWLSQE
jgi:DNA-binding LytR/AlgR family response regulator